MITCAEAMKLIEEKQDAELPLGSRIRLRMHLMMCKICPNFDHQLQQLRRIMRTCVAKLAESADLPELPEAARTRIRAAVARKRKAASG